MKRRTLLGETNVHRTCFEVFKMNFLDFLVIKLCAEILYVKSEMQETVQ